jgi:hypothetical protein
MKITEQKVEIWEQPKRIERIYKETKQLFGLDNMA